MPANILDGLPEEAAPLGTPIAVFKARPSYALFYLISGSFCIISGAITIVRIPLGLLGGPGPAQPSGMIELSWRGFWSLVWLVLGAIMIYRWRQTHGLKVFVFPDGLARVDRQRADVVYWNEIRAVRWDNRSRRNEMTLTTPFQLVLEQGNGPPLVFTESVRKLQELRQLVEERTLPHLRRAALQDVQAGQTISFGVVRVNKDEIHDPGGSLPWDGLASTEVVKGRLLLREVGDRRPFATFTRSQVPNLHVLVALAEHLRTNRV
jgi:hypothetical protein